MNIGRLFNKQQQTKQDESAILNELLNMQHNGQDKSDAARGPMPSRFHELIATLKELDEVERAAFMYFMTNKKDLSYLENLTIDDWKRYLAAKCSVPYQIPEEVIEAFEVWVRNYGGRSGQKGTEAHQEAR